MNLHVFIIIAVQFSSDVAGFLFFEKVISLATVKAKHFKALPHNFLFCCFKTI